MKILCLLDEGPKVREVRIDTTTMNAKCSCMLFETHGIPCCHIIHVLRGERLNELPSQYILQRWTKKCKRESVVDEYGHMLEENGNSSSELEIKKMCSEMRNEMEDIFKQAGHSVDTMQLVRSKFQRFVDEARQEISSSQKSRVEEMEEFISSQLPTQIDILLPNDVHTKGRAKRIKGHFDTGVNKQKEEANKKI